MARFGRKARLVTAVLVVGATTAAGPASLADTHAPLPRPAAAITSGTAATVVGSLARLAPTAGPLSSILPLNLQAPTVQGQPIVWQTLTASPGSWLALDTPTYTYQWQRCSADGKTCADIPGATSSSYKLRWQDIGSTFDAVATATDQFGQTSATSSPTAVVSSGGQDPVIAAAGDIACDPTATSFHNGDGTATACREKYTSDLVADPNADLAGVLALGDNQYYCGSLANYQQVYDPTWGRVKDITYPAPGNHEYLPSGGVGCDASNATAAGYFNYFGAAAGPAGQGYYSFDLGAWHLLSLNSQCSSIGGCGAGSSEWNWVQNDLAAHSNQCTLAYWHIPLYSSGGRAQNNMQQIWSLLYQAGADVVLSAHDHIYERFAPQDANGNLDQARGITEFVVGTGGANHTAILSPLAANSLVQDNTTFGVLKLALHPTSYDWTFEPDPGSGSFTDSGSASCH